MHLKISSLCLLCSISTLIAQDDVLSQIKQDNLNFSYQKAIEDSSKLKKDWINPITYKFIYSNGEKYDTQKSFISISQPIFKSGGIYYAIKYANSMEKLSKTSIDIQKKELIKQVVNLLFQIKKLDISIQKQELLIKNATLDIARKKEQVLNGILDTSFLDSAIIEGNMKKNGLIDLEYQRVTLTNNLATLSNKKYEDHHLPILTLTNNNKFIDKNIYLQQAKEDIDTSYWMKNMITSNYLPTVNFTADYTKYHDTDNNPALNTDGSTNFGFNITIPLDIKYSYNIESYKIAYLQQKLALKDKKQTELSIFRNSIAKIDSLDKKIIIAKKDVELYDSLVVQLIEQQTVGMKTQSDVDTMINSKKSKILDIQSLEIDKQIELLEIYSRIQE